jgi:hypothetical protein
MNIRDVASCSLAEVDRLSREATKRRPLCPRAQRHARQSVRYQVLTAASVNVAVFWGVAPRGLVGVDRRFRGATSSPNDRGSKHLRNVSHLLWDYTEPTSEWTAVFTLTVVRCWNLTSLKYCTTKFKKTGSWVVWLTPWTQVQCSCSLCSEWPLYKHVTCKQIIGKQCPVCVARHGHLTRQADGYALLCFVIYLT